MDVIRATIDVLLSKCIDGPGAQGWGGVAESFPFNEIDSGVSSNLTARQLNVTDDHDDYSPSTNLSAPSKFCKYVGFSSLCLA